MGKDDMTLSDKIEKTLTVPRNSSNTVEGSLKEVLVSENLVLLFNKLAEDQNLKKLIFLHRFDLFRIGEVTNVPYLFFCPRPKSNAKAKDEIGESRLLSHIVDTKHQAIDVKGKKFFQKIEDEDTGFDELSKILLYLLVHFIRSTPKVLKLSTGEAFDYKILSQELSIKENPIDIGTYIDKLMLDYNDPKKFDPILKGKLEGLAVRLAESGIKQAGPSIENIAGMLPDLMMQFHKISFHVMVNLMNLTGMGYSEYEGVLNNLYLCKLIENKSAMFWCESCSKDQLTYGMETVNAAPENFRHIRKCIRCRQKQKFSVIYGLNTQFKDIFYSKDGLLSVYFGWLLEKYAIKYKPSKYVNDYESDFIVRNQILVECKTIVAAKDEKTLQTKLYSALNQIATHLDNLTKEKIKIEKAALLWNIWECPKELLESATKTFPMLFNNYSLSIVGPAEVENFVQKLI